jgi:hypothetical protein
MQKKTITEQKDQRLLERLNRRPDLKERIEAILALAEEGEEGELRSADEIEALLVEEIRRLGSQTMQEWAEGAHAKVSAEMKQKKGCRVGKKKR